MLKKISFWLPSMYIPIILINYLGYDDKNIIIFMTNPLFWILEQFSVGFPIELYYILGLFFWFFVGILLDCIKKKIKTYMHQNILGG